MTVNGLPAPPALLWRKHLALLVYLARTPGGTRARDHLVALLWGDRPEAAARHSLNEALRVIRRTAGEAALDTTGGRVRLAGGVVALDVDQLRAAVRDGSWTEAAALVRGEFLEGLSLAGAGEFDDWLAAERLLWRSEGAAALMRCAEAHAAAGELAAATDLAERALALTPHADAAARALMHVHALAGHGALATAVYQSFAARLGGSIGATPTPETTALADRVRRGAGRHPRRADSPPSAAGARRPTPLVGRAAERAALLGAVAEVGAGARAAIWFVEGGPGSGKTRMLEEVTTRAGLEGWTVATARAVPGDAGTPWSLLGGLAAGGLLDAPGVAAAAPRALAGLAAVDHAWAQRYPGSAVAAIMPVRRGLCEVLRAVAEDSPVVLAVDDAQWSDAETLEALAAATRDLARAPLLLLLAIRAHVDRADIDQLQERLGRDVPGGVVRMAAFDHDALRALASSFLPGWEADGIDRLARRLAADTAGIPLFASEIVRAIGSGMDLGRFAAPWPAAARTLDEPFPTELPDTVVAAVRVNFRRLSPDARTVLGAAAVLGGRRVEALLGVAAGIDGNRLAAALDAVEAERWLVADGRGYTFSASLVGAVIARDLVTAGQRRRILGRVDEPSRTA